MFSETSIFGAEERTAREQKPVVGEAAQAREITS